MVARGLFVFDNILCQHPESPPPGVDTTPPEVTPGQSQRDYSEERTGNPSCAGCHLQFEPFAWGLERYLADGSHSLVDHLGNELREDGALRLPGEDDPLPYENAAEMVELLAGADAVRECLAVKGTQFAIGRPLADNDECSIGKLQERFSDSGQTWRDLVLSIALSPGFRSIRVES
jgi:hypothetical protein